MSTDTIKTDPETLSDAQAVIAALASGQKPDPVIVRRIHERSAKTRERVLREHGPVDIAVPSIREFRDS
ncbi:MAG: hypothetical protein EXS05_09405 [Planctomycetaceae bacterium]|nr:hypothetical protein [Planctomycetaceae bacterium]